MAATASRIAEWIRCYLKEEVPRSKSLIVSAFGDSIAAQASGIWLGDLIRLMDPFGVSERLVRTSAFRLVDEGWLEARREGRRSYYSVTPSGTRRFELAYGRIYTPPQTGWNGSWTVILLPKNGDTGLERTELRRELEWEGFASPTPGVMMHPAANHHVLHQILLDLGVIDRTLVMQARAAEAFSVEPVGGMVSRCWDLAEVEKLYGRFVDRFRPLLAKLEPASLSPQQAFIVQTLLIHSFRRASLHDPRLPAPLLPPLWPGLNAYELCRQIYRMTFRLAQVHLKNLTQADSAPGRPPKLGEHVRERFGGLE